VCYLTRTTRLLTTVSQFYITDKESAALAKEAVVDRKPITMSGTEPIFHRHCAVR
jgi:hypothetical protein